MSYRKCLISGMTLFSTLLLSAGNVSALNITIYDGTHDTSHTGTGVGLEDGETEPGMVNSQVWDLEGFFQNGNDLSMIGGYNFKVGEGQFESGDIFLSTDNLYGNDGYYTSTSTGNDIVNSNFGYEYVIDLDLVGLSYSVYALDPTDTTITAYYPANENDTPGSNPWRYDSGGELLTTGNFIFEEGLNDTETGFLGGMHYSLTGFDLSFLGYDQEFYSHFTMGCGNDNLMGHGTTAPVPEPATMLLFGTGLVGIAGSRLRKKKK